MKIAICINTSWNIYNFRRGLIDHFLERGDEVLAMAPYDEYSEKLVEIGCAYEQVEMSASGLNPVKDFQVYLNIRAVLKKHQPDVLLSYTIKPNIYGSFAAGLLGVPAICNVSGLGTVFLWKGSVRTIATSLYSFAFRFNKWIFFQNQYDREEFARFVKIDLNKTSLLPGSGMNVHKFTPQPDPDNEVPVFLMLARLLVEKGVNEYIEAVKIVRKKGKKAHFRLVGGLDEGHSRSVPKVDLDQWISEGLIEYSDHVEDVKPLIAAADVVVLPSYREGTPRTLLEAGAMGKPLIATDVPGCNSVVQDGYNGFLCKVKSGQDLASKMLLMLSLAKAERLEIGKSARKFVEENFDEKIVIGQYVDKINDLTIKT